VVVAPLLAAAVMLGACGWIYRDAKANLEAGTPVMARIGNLHIETPEAWAASCVVLFLVFPLT
jgi:hypothetical protein